MLPLIAARYAFFSSSENSCVCDHDTEPVAVACPLTVPLFPLWEPETERLPPSVTFTVTAYLGGDDPGTTLTLARMLPSGRAATWIVGPRRAAGAFRPGAGCDPATGALGCGCCWVCPFAFAAPGGGAGAGASFGGGVVARVVCDGAGGLTAVAALPSFSTPAAQVTAEDASSPLAARAAAQAWAWRSAAPMSAPLSDAAPAAVRTPSSSSRGPWARALPPLRSVCPWPRSRRAPARRTSIRVSARSPRRRGLRWICAVAAPMARPSPRSCSRFSSDRLWLAFSFPLDRDPGPRVHRVWSGAWPPPSCATVSLRRHLRLRLWPRRQSLWSCSVSSRSSRLPTSFHPSAVFCSTGFPRYALPTLSSPPSFPAACRPRSPR